MSKLYDQYLYLKKNNNKTVYLFKAGVFYYFLDEDAKKISELFNLKLLPLNETVLKCSIPVSRLGYYISEFQKMNINFEIIDNQYAKIENHNDYLKNEQLKSVLKKIKDLDLNNITMRNCYDILEELQIKLKELK